MKRIEFARIGVRLGTAFALLLLLLVMVAITAILEMRHQEHVIRRIVNEQSLKASLAEDMERSAQGAALPLLRLLLTQEREQRVPLYKEIDNANDNGEKDLKALTEASALDSASEIDTLHRLAGQRETYITSFRDTVEKIELSGPDSAYVHFSKQTEPALRTLLQGCTELVAHHRQAMQSAQQELEQTLARTQFIMVFISLGAIALGCVMSWSTTRSITLPLAQAVTATERVAAGDLSTNIPTGRHDETGDLLSALHRMQSSLAKTVKNVRQNAQSVAAASSEIAQGNHDLSDRTEQQAVAVEKTASSTEELNATVQQNADNAVSANQLATSASRIAARGGEVVSQVVTTMQGINESSRRIGDIIGVIDGIAFQTNLLALNAAVEAAKAGEQGRGFAVVASEVRSLAGRSAGAAREIKSLIAASVKQVEQGSELVGKAGATMKEVVDSIRRVTDIMGEISVASSEQANGVRQVGEAVTDMDRNTQQNAALVEQMAAAASSLSIQAEELVNAMAAFKLA